jgi:ABC-2 type transport system permease protein
LNASTPAPASVSAVRVCIAMLARDARVIRREMVSFVVRTALQPLLITIVFGFLLPHMGYVTSRYTAALLPGVLGICLAMSSLQAVALPMITDFGYFREIDDRLLAPIPIEVVAFEKVASGTLQGMLGGLLVLPIVRLIMGPIAGLDLLHSLEVVPVLLLSSAAFSALGLLLGTALQGQQIGLMFSIIVAPMMTFGCAYYPWQALRVVPVLQWLVLVNPLVYVSEALRAALTPGMPHMPTVISVSALVAIGLAFWFGGLRTFRKRALS